LRAWQYYQLSGRFRHFGLLGRLRSGFCPLARDVTVS
jgi:hypothetical protein